MSEKYTKQMLEKAAKKSESVTGVMRELGITYLSGNMRTHIKKRLEHHKIDTSHFLGSNWVKGKKSPKRLTPKDVFVYDRCNGNKEKVATLRRCMIESGIEHSCKFCDLSSEWNSKPLTLQIDHIDGDFLNNKINNLRFLCPNCHSQTETFGGKNKVKK